MLKVAYCPTSRNVLLRTCSSLEQGSFWKTKTSTEIQAFHSLQPVPLDGRSQELNTAIVDIRKRPKKIRGKGSWRPWLTRTKATSRGNIGEIVCLHSATVIVAPLLLLFRPLLASFSCQVFSLIVIMQAISNDRPLQDSWIRWLPSEAWCRANNDEWRVEASWTKAVLTEWRIKYIASQIGFIYKSKFSRGSYWQWKTRIPMRGNWRSDPFCTCSYLGWWWFPDVLRCFM